MEEMNEKEIKNLKFNELPERKTLGISDKFGYEIECGFLDDYQDLYSKEFLCSGFLYETDNSIKHGNSLEISTPVFEDDAYSWNKLTYLSNILMNHNIDFRDCSFQINFDINLSNEELMNLFKIYAVYESIIYRMSTGSDKFLRDNAEYYARAVRTPLLIINNNEYGFQGISEIFEFNKTFGISLKNVNNKEKFDVIEFRTPNGCSDIELWKNYTIFFSKLLESVNKADMDKISYRLERMPIMFSYDCYKMCNFDLAKEFANLVFDNELDKLYFYKQYLGLYRTKEVKKLKLV